MTKIYYGEYLGFCEEFYCDKSILFCYQARLVGDAWVRQCLRRQSAGLGYAEKLRVMEQFHILAVVEQPDGSTFFRSRTRISNSFNFARLSFMLFVCALVSWHYA